MAYATGVGRSFSASKHVDRLLVNALRTVLAKIALGWDIQGTPSCIYVGTGYCDNHIFASEGWLNRDFVHREGLL
jgi:hypothetical protein